MKRSRLILLDANVVEHLFKIGIWDLFVERCEVHLARTVAEVEAHCYEDDDGQLQHYDLKPYELDGKIHIFDVFPSELDQFRLQFDRGYFDRLDDGETESLVHLLKHQGEFRISSADGIVFRVLANLGLEECGVSLGTLLAEVGLARKLVWPFDERFRQRYSAQGAEERIRGIGQQRGPGDQQG